MNKFTNNLEINCEFKNRFRKKDHSAKIFDNIIVYYCSVFYFIIFK